MHSFHCYKYSCMIPGLSLLLGAVLRQIPIAVLFGVFLYMGVASMSGIQFFERMELVFMPVKHHPDVGFVRKVRQSQVLQIKPFKISEKTTN